MNRVVQILRVLAELATMAVLTGVLTIPAFASQDPPTTPVPKTPEVPKPVGTAGATEDQLPAPPMPGKMKTIATKVQTSSLVQRLRNHGDGWYPRAFGIWTGASWSAGAGYRQHILDDRAVFDGSGEYSVRGYRLLQTSLEFPALPHRLYFRGDARYRHFPQEDFFGIGGASREPNRTTYLLRTGELWSTLGMRVRPRMTAGVEFGWMNVHVDSGTDTRYPSIEELFADQTAPGLITQPNYVRSGVFWEYDARDEPGYPHAGTKYRVTFNDYRDVTFSRYSFKRFDADVSTFMPSPRAGHTIALRGRVTYANNKPGHIVPFYMLPTLGGGSSLRAFDEFRYRDENALLLNAEYWIPVHKFADLAIFSDAGKASHDYQGINPKGLIADYGAGLRMHTATRMIFRFDIAHGREGTRFLAKVNQPF